MKQMKIKNTKKIAAENMFAAQNTNRFSPLYIAVTFVSPMVRQK